MIFSPALMSLIGLVSVVLAAYVYDDVIVRMYL